MHSEQLKYDCGPFLQLLSEDFQEADFSIANMEFPLGGKPYRGYPSFSTPDYYADYASECGIDIFLTANNHISDKGDEGFKRTLEYYSGMEGVYYTGSGAEENDMARRNPVFLQRKGTRIAVVNFTYGTNGPSNSSWPKVMKESDKEEILSAIGRARKGRADVIVACPHWGVEYKLIHNEAQEEVATWLIDNGVDLIVGAHPHVVQDMAVLKGKTVYYSLGNAVSNMSATNTQIGLMACISIVRDESGKVRIGQTGYKWLWCSRPGGFQNNYTVIPIEEYLGKKDMWVSKEDYDNMVLSQKRVSEKTGIPIE